MRQLYTLQAVLKNLTVFELLSSVQETAIKIRRNTSLKLPDSIISATAIVGGYVLVTDDVKLSARHVGTVVSLAEVVGGG